jgi:hypothetical protein
LEATFRKRFSQRWQASLNYSLAKAWNATSAPIGDFPLAPDMGGEYTGGRRPAASGSDERRLGYWRRTPIERDLFLRLRGKNGYLVWIDLV